MAGALRSLLLLALGAFAVMTPMTAQVAQADPGYAYYWSLTFDFENSFDGVLRVDVGHNENGGVLQPPLYSETFAVTCQRVGSVALVGGGAQFNGGYLKCTLDVKSALVATFAKCNQIHTGCRMNIGDVERYRNFRMFASVVSTAAGNAPLFTHEDSALSIAPGTSNTQMTAALTPVGALSSSPVTAGLNTQQGYLAEYECAAAGCAMYASITGASQVQNLANNWVEFSTPASSIFIGHDPATGTIIPAGTDLRALYIDPPNFGNH